MVNGSFNDGPEETVKVSPRAGGTIGVGFAHNAQKQSHFPNVNTPGRALTTAIES